MSTTRSPTTSVITTLPPSTTTVAAGPTTEEPWISLSPQFAVFDENFFYYLYASAGSLLSFLLLGRFFMLSMGKQVQLSWQLKVNLFVWLVSLFFAFALYSTIFGKYATPYRIYNLNSELIRGSLHVASTNTLPLSTTFLLLDRILAISFIGQKLNAWRRHLQWFSVLAICVMFVANVSTLIYRTTINPPDPSLSCTFSCRMNGTIKDLLLVKLVTAILNVICGAIFVYLYVRYSRSLTFRLERKFNHTTMFVFVSELFCNIIPTGVYLIGSPYLEFMNAMRFTTIMVTICHISDGLATSILYWMTRISTKSVVKKLLVNPISKIHSSLSKKTAIKNQRTWSTSVKPQTC